MIAKILAWVFLIIIGGPLIIGGGMMCVGVAQKAEASTNAIQRRPYEADKPRVNEIRGVNKFHICENGLDYLVLIMHDDYGSQIAVANTGQPCQ